MDDFDKKYKAVEELIEVLREETLTKFRALKDEDQNKLYEDLRKNHLEIFGRLEKKIIEKFGDFRQPEIVVFLSHDDCLGFYSDQYYESEFRIYNNKYSKLAEYIAEKFLNLEVGEGITLEEQEIRRYIDVIYSHHKSEVYRDSSVIYDFRKMETRETVAIKGYLFGRKYEFHIYSKEQVCIKRNS